MARKLNVLFVCSGNYFRSQIAEFYLKEYMKKNKLSWIKVESAGTKARKTKDILGAHKELRKDRVFLSQYRQKHLTRKRLARADVIIAMAQNHYDYIVNKYERVPFLFNELAIKKSTSVPDVSDVLPHYVREKEKALKYIDSVAKYIKKNTPALAKEISGRATLFEGFIEKKNRADGLPFTPIYQTKNTIAFLSKDIPEHEDGHVLVIPKKRYRLFEEVPLYIKKELMESIEVVGKAILKHHDGYNILLNNGNAAGQWILHTHFHVVPRNHGDGIKIGVWGRKKVTAKKFVEYSKKLKRQVEEIKKSKQN